MPEDIEKYNPYHGKDGRFTSGGGKEHSVSLTPRARAIVERHNKEGKYNGGKPVDTNMPKPVKEANTRNIAGENHKLRGHIKEESDKPGDIEINLIMEHTGVDQSKAKQYQEAVNKFTQGYSKAIRKAMVNPSSSDGAKKVGNTIDEFISKSPKFDGEVHRGIRLDNKQLSELNKSVGKDIDMKGQSSWSSSKKTAENYSNPVPNMNPVIFSVANKSGTSIKHLSQFQNEDEVLHPSTSKYKIESISKKTGSKGEYTHVQVVEV